MRSLLDLDMQQFSNLLMTIIRQADLLANTLDENSEQHETLKKMLAAQTVDSERQSMKLGLLEVEKQKVLRDMAEMRRQHAYEITVSLSRTLPSSPSPSLPTSFSLSPLPLAILISK